MMRKLRSTDGRAFLAERQTSDAMAFHTTLLTTVNIVRSANCIDMALVESGN